jgi:glycine oxidase
MLAPTVEGLPAEVLAAAVAARDVYPRFLATLRDRAGIDVPLDRNGILELATSEPELEAIFARLPAGSERVDARALAALEPALARHPGAALHPTDGAVDNVTLMDALDVALARQPRITRVVDEVASLDLLGTLPAFRSRGGTRYAGPRLLVAGGAWAGSLPGLPRALPVRPLRGQLLRLEGRPIGHVTYGAGGYLVPRGMSLVIGATSEEAGFECATTPWGLAALRAIAVRSLPALSHATVLDHWAGFRPVSPDGLPILGPDPAVPSLCYACGFSRNGILFAPWAAEQLVAALVDGTAPATLAPFAPTRFEAHNRR